MPSPLGRVILANHHNFAGFLIIGHGDGFVQVVLHNGAPLVFAGTEDGVGSGDDGAILVPDQHREGKGPSPVTAVGLGQLGL